MCFGRVVALPTYRAKALLLPSAGCSKNGARWPRSGRLIQCHFRRIGIDIRACGIECDQPATVGGGASAEVEGKTQRKSNVKSSLYAPCNTGLAEGF